MLRTVQLDPPCSGHVTADRFSSGRLQSEGGVGKFQYEADTKLVTEGWMSLQ